MDSPARPLFIFSGLARGLLLLAWLALALPLAGASTQARDEMRRIQDPATYTSPDGRWCLSVDPCARRMAPHARLELLDKGERVWSLEEGPALRRVQFLGDGTVVAIQLVEIEGFPGDPQRLRMIAVSTSGEPRIFLDEPLDRSAGPSWTRTARIIGFTPLNGGPQVMVRLKSAPRFAQPRLLVFDLDRPTEQVTQPVASEDWIIKEWPPRPPTEPADSKPSTPTCVVRALPSIDLAAILQGEAWYSGGEATTATGLAGGLIGLVARKERWACVVDPLQRKVLNHLSIPSELELSGRTRLVSRSGEAQLILQLGSSGWPCACFEEGELRWLTEEDEVEFLRHDPTGPGYLAYVPRRSHIARLPKLARIAAGGFDVLAQRRMDGTWFRGLWGLSCSSDGGFAVLDIASFEDMFPASSSVLSGHDATGSGRWQFALPLEVHFESVAYSGTQVAALGTFGRSIVWGDTRGEALPLCVLAGGGDLGLGNAVWRGGIALVDEGQELWIVGVKPCILRRFRRD